MAPEGTGYRARTRFAKFFNLPELMNMFKEIADIKTADQLNLPMPEVEYHNIVSERQVRVLIGSTQKMGAGTNVQDRLIALHDLDCPWRPVM